MTITSQQIVDAGVPWLPVSNIVEEATLLIIANNLISTIGDDDAKEGEVTCKYLGAVADVNAALAVVDVGSVTMEKIKEHERRQEAKDMQKVWGEYKKSLGNICPIFGRTPTITGLTMYINPGTRPCPLTD